MRSKLKNKLEIYFDNHVSEVVYGLMLVFFLKFIGSALSFGFNVAVARSLGSDGMGVYLLALSVSMIGSVLGRVGLDNTLLRYISTYKTQHEWGKVRGVYLLSMCISGISSFLVTFLFFVASPWVAVNLFDNPELIIPMQWMSLSIVPVALMNLHAESLKGLKCLRQATVTQSIGLPLISLLLFYPMVLYIGLNGVVLAYLVGVLIVAFVGLYYWFNEINKRPRLRPEFNVKELTNSCRPLFFVAILNAVIKNWAPILCLGVFAQTEDVAIYGAAFRLVAIVSMLLYSLNSVLAPKIAELYVTGDMMVLAATARRSAAILMLLSMPIFAVLIIGSDWVMGIYGPEFLGNGAILSILAIGQIVNVFAGCLGPILVVSGNEKYVLRITFIFTIVLLVLLFSLVPVWGALGAAVAVGLSGAGLSIVTVWQARKIVGYSVVPSLRHIKLFG